jgi:hypothetical protein
MAAGKITSRTHSKKQSTNGWRPAIVSSHASFTQWHPPEMKERMEEEERGGDELGVRIMALVRRGAQKGFVLEFQSCKSLFS